MLLLFFAPLAVTHYYDVPTFGEVLNARRNGKWEIREGDSVTVPLPTFFTDSEWLCLDLLNKEVNSELHDVRLHEKDKLFKVLLPDSVNAPSAITSAIVKAGIVHNAELVQVKIENSISGGSVQLHNLSACEKLFSGSN